MWTQERMRINCPWVKLALSEEDPRCDILKEACIWKVKLRVWLFRYRLVNSLDELYNITGFSVAVLTWAKWLRRSFFLSVIQLLPRQVHGREKQKFIFVKSCQSFVALWIRCFFKKHGHSAVYKLILHHDQDQYETAASLRSGICVAFPGEFSAFAILAASTTEGTFSY